MKTVTFKWRIARKKIPYPTAALCEWTGAVQSPVWENVDPCLTMTGQTSGQDVGEYHVTFTLDENHCWMDGSTGPKEIVWTISPQLLDAPVLATNQFTFEYDAGGITTRTVSLVSGTEHVSLSGATSGSHAGTYTAIATADPGYAFKPTVETNASGQVELFWTIAQYPITASYLTLASKPYTGSQLMPDLNGYSNLPIGALTLTVPEAVNAGTYNVTWSLNDTSTTDASDFKWGNDVTVDADGNAITQWTITKIDCAITTSKSSVSLQIENPVQEGTLTVDKTALAFIGIGEDYAQYIEVETNIPDGIEISVEPEGIVDVEIVDE